MSETNDPAPARSEGFLPKALTVPLVAIMILIFIVFRFPWDAVGRRVAWEISRVSGARVDVSELAPGLSARGPVLRAREVMIQHPAIDRVRVSEFEIAPRFSSSWLSAEPTLRVFARTDLGHADGVLRLGESPAYAGRVTEVDLARIPLRLQASALELAGRLDADADVSLDPGGTLAGRVDFESPSLEVKLPMLPIPLRFHRTVGTVEILDSGDTRISEVRFEGDALEGSLAGEIGLVHRSQSPPIDLEAEIQIKDPTLRSLAPSAGIRLDGAGRAHIVMSGTVDDPRMSVVGEAAPR